MVSYKLLFLFLINFSHCLASSVFLYSNNKKKEINLFSYKNIVINSTNYSPTFNYTKAKFSGPLVTDLLKDFKISDEQNIYFIDKSLNFVVAVKFAELKKGAIIALHRDQKSLEKEERGISLVWPDSFLNSIEENKRRKYSCWWAKYIIIESNNILKNNENHSEIKAALKFPVPKGYNLAKVNNLIKNAKGEIYKNVKKIYYTNINDEYSSVSLNGESVFIRDGSIFNNSKLGGKTIHVISEIKEDTIFNFKKSFFFIKDYKIVK